MPTPRLVILDFDGTLADSFPWMVGALADAARRFGFRNPDAAAIEQLRGEPNRSILKSLGVPAWKLPAIGLHMRALAAAAPPPPLFPGIEEALHRLADGGVVLALASSNAEAQIRRTLGPTLAARIPHLACEASLFGKAARFRRILRAAGLPAAGAIAIGDESRDIEAARQAGIAAGAVAWGYASPGLLRALRPDAWFETPADLARLLPG
ncbi:HAD hydrolase-like protein [Falsiroseomonas sp. CW058]|uniref:HAD hydrolase-like protein n=1 Tax=Falsiroseomonas sp. CW058 TaxID=3388664 RepID=UPI003D31C37B